MMKAMSPNEPITKYILGRSSMAAQSPKKNTDSIPNENEEEPKDLRILNGGRIDFNFN